MDSFLLGHAVQKNGPALIRNLKEENQHFPENVVHYISKYREKPPGFQDPELKEKICRFISKKADYLFITPSEKEEKERKTSDYEDTFAKMPPLETYMGIPEIECRKNFFNSVEKHDIVIGVVSSVMDSGLVITLLCLDSGKSRDIDQLRISAFCPVKELPKLFPNQDAIEGFQVRDKVRAVVLSVNPETEKLIVSMVERSLPENNSDVKLALINEDEFPVQYRRKLHIRGLTFDELLHSILGFNNSGNIGIMLETLDQEETYSLMRGLNRINIPEKDMAENLRKYQSQKMAHTSVAQGITYFKAGKQPEAVQCFNKALDIDKTNVEALVARGALYANNESFNRAIDDFEDALKINSVHANARKYLHDTLLAYGKSNEDIEKYQEAEELYTKAMSLDQASVEAREALRFLHYRRSQRRQKETRRQSSPKDERRNKSPEGFEQTARTLKKLIKGEDKRQRKKRRISRDSSSSSTSSSTSSSDSSDSRSSRESLQRRRKGHSRERDRTHRNSSPPEGDVNREPVYEPEVQPHQEYGIDLQSSFLSGGGQSFSDMFRSSSQESDVGPAQPIPNSMQYGANHHMYGHPPPNWFGIPGAEQAQIYRYSNQFTSQEQMYPGVPPTYYQNQPMTEEGYSGHQGNSSRSPSRRSGRSRSDRRSRSSSFESRRRRPSRSPSYEKDQHWRKDDMSPRRSRSRSLKHERGRSPLPKYRKTTVNLERSPDNRRNVSRGERNMSNIQGRSPDNRRNVSRGERNMSNIHGRSPDNRRNVSRGGSNMSNIQGRSPDNRRRNDSRDERNIQYNQDKSYQGRNNSMDGRNGGYEGDKSPGYRRRNSSHERTSEYQEGRHIMNKSQTSWSGSPVNFEGSRRKITDDRGRSPTDIRNVRRGRSPSESGDFERRSPANTSSSNRLERWSMSPRDNQQYKIDENVEREISSRRSFEREPKEVENRAESIELNKEEQSTELQKLPEDLSKNENRSKTKSGKKKKGLTDEKVKSKKKRKESGETKKKVKKKLASNQGKTSGEITLKNEGTSEVDYIGSSSVGDIRRVVPKESSNDQPYSSKLLIRKDDGEIKNRPKKRKEHEFVNQLVKSKWDDSPGEMRNSPAVKQSREDLSQVSNYSKQDYDAKDRLRRSNSREFEGIRIHITNDQFGKQTEKKEDVGVVEMFHINEQPVIDSSKSIKSDSDSKASKPKGASNIKLSKNNSELKEIKKENPKPIASGDNKRSYRRRSLSPSQKSKSRSLSRPRSQHRTRSRTRSRSRKRSRHRSRSRPPQRSRSRSRKRYSRSPRRSYKRSPPMRKSGRGFAKTRPVIMGRNKFTDSKSPSISPGRKVAGLKTRSKSPKRHKSYSSYRGRGQGSYRGSSYRGRGSWKSSKGYRPHRSRSRSRGRSRSKSRSRRSHERKSRSPHNRGHLKDRDHKTPNPKDDVKQKNKGKFDSEKFDELEDFYHKLKENKKKQTETK
ncbi:tetratricopeptide repeat protein 14-like isoform X2 [Mytilus californianus]|uniref:tetratricopeptide repeat protein 14-like isoform X2 n=1 Tax=Mytilus californianus TaxID=6549 RepID=UPI0022465794|nr:tetratricopeptide repeat protein 14-like isoform X2 [Mytilus californianus]